MIVLGSDDRKSPAPGLNSSLFRCSGVPPRSKGTTYPFKVLLLVALVAPACWGQGRGGVEGVGIIGREHYSGPIVFSPDGETLAVPGLECGRLELWSLATNQIRQAIVSPSNKGGGCVLHVAFSKDRHSIAIEYQDRGISIWDLEKGRERTFIPFGPGRWAEDLAFVDGRTLGAIMAKSTVGDLDRPDRTLWNHWSVRWDAATGKELETQVFDPRHRFNALSPDGRYASLGTETSQTVFNLATGKLAFTSAINDRGVFVFADDGSTLVAYTETALTVWDVPSGKKSLQFANPPGRSSSPTEPSISFDNKRLAVGHFTRTNDVGLIDIETGKVIETFVIAPDEMICRAVRFAPGGCLLVTDIHGVDNRDQGVDPVLRLWKIPATK